MSNIQLNFFETYTPPPPAPEFHWQSCFPEWMPKVGGYCSFDTVTYSRRAGAPVSANEAEERYSYMAELKILAIDGRNIDCIGVARKYYQGCEEHVGKLYFLTVDDIWLATYISEDRLKYVGKTFLSPMGREFTVAHIYYGDGKGELICQCDRDYDVDASMLDTWEDITPEGAKLCGIIECITPEVIEAHRKAEKDDADRFARLEKIDNKLRKKSLKNKTTTK